MKLKCFIDSASNRKALIIQKQNRRQTSIHISKERMNQILITSISCMKYGIIDDEGLFQKTIKDLTNLIFGMPGYNVYSIIVYILTNMLNSESATVRQFGISLLTYIGNSACVK